MDASRQICKVVLRGEGGDLQGKEQECARLIISAMVAIPPPSRLLCMGAFCEGGMDEGLFAKSTDSRVECVHACV